jgi:hypothetical protein
MSFIGRASSLRNPLCMHTCFEPIRGGLNQGVDLTFYAASY